MRIKTLNRAAALVIVAAASIGCSDSAIPTSPSVNRPLAAVQAAPIKPRPRGINISDVQLSSIYVSISGGYTPYTVTVTNPTSKDIGNIYLRGELQSQNNQPPLPVSAFLARCPNPNGVVARGQSCVNIFAAWVRTRPATPASAM